MFWNFILKHSPFSVFFFPCIFQQNGFKCHMMSESHQRQLLLFAENPDKYVDDFSQWVLKENPDKYTDDEYMQKEQDKSSCKYNVQSRLSYATLQGTETKRSHMTGCLLIQSPYIDQSEKYVPLLKIVKFERNHCMYQIHSIHVQTKVEH